MDEKNIVVSNDKIVESLNTMSPEATVALIQELCPDPQAVLNSFVDLADRMYKTSTQAMTTIYCQALAAEVAREARELDSKDEAIKRYNDQVDKLLDTISFDDPAKMDIVIKFMQESRETLKPELYGIQRKSLLDRLPWRKNRR